MTGAVDDKAALKALIRSDFSYFIRKVFNTVSPGDEYLHNWHIEAIAYQLKRVIEGETRRLIITIPPRHLKSISASVALPAYLMGHDPTQRTICVSYAQDLATQFSLDTRRVMESDWYRECFPNTRLSKHKNTQDLIQLTKGGSRRATSVGGTLTGVGGDILIIDDPHKADEAESDAKRQKTVDWYPQTASTRLNDPSTGKIILVQQRFHEQDLAGTLLEAGGWEHLNLPAIAESEENIAIGPDAFHHRLVGDALHPERMSKEELEQKAKEMGKRAFAGQYQQRPAPADGDIIRLEWFKSYEHEPEECIGDRILQSWDAAYTINQSSDYSVCITFLYQAHQIYILDVYREKMEFPELKTFIPEHADRWKAEKIVLETTGTGGPLIQELRKQHGFNGHEKYWSHTPKEDKKTRVMRTMDLLSSGRIHLPQNAPWLDDFRRELLTFPNGKHDDQIDALSQGLMLVRRACPQPGDYEPGVLWIG